MILPRSLVCGSLSVLILAGCASSGSLFRDPSQLVHDPGRLIGRPRIEKNVVRILSLWEASQGKDPADKPARGFAGQVLFFGPKSEIGARVHGKVVIYQYDNYDPESLDEPIPLHSFTFEPEAWDVHRGEGTLGHSYSCFIPYMNKHREQVNCGLKVELISDDGARVCSEIVEVLLPSRTASTRAAQKTRGFVREARIGGLANLHPDITRAGTETTPAESRSETTSESLDTLSIPLPRSSSR